MAVDILYGRGVDRRWGIEPELADGRLREEFFDGNRKGGNMGSEIATDEELRDALSRLEARQLDRTRRRGSASTACKEEFRLWDELIDKAASALKLAMANKRSLDTCLSEKDPTKCRHFRDDLESWFTRYEEYERRGRQAYDAWIHCEGIPPSEDPK